MAREVTPEWASRLAALDPDLGAEVRAALLVFRPTVFVLRRYAEHLSVDWVDGPTAPAVREALHHLGPILPLYVPDLHFVCRRKYSTLALCAALDFVASQGGFPREVVAAGEEARSAVASRKSDPYVALFQRDEWAGPDQTGFALPLASRMLAALGLIDLSGAVAGAVRPGVAGVVERVETMSALASDAGISRPEDLVLWAAAHGYAVSDELAASRTSLA